MKQLQQQEDHPTQYRKIYYSEPNVITKEYNRVEMRSERCTPWALV